MLLCLDPHFSQPASSEEGHLNQADDLTHHCEQPIQMPLQLLDPSLVLGFVCPTEADSDTLYANLETEVLSRTEQRSELFELHRTRPSNLPPISSH
ncbi:Autophagin-1 (C54 family) [Fasciola gigantica]|uniref:Cysteine protease n=1 Tax=Fasciola gigantica TaxID=46835 RepID=A0A504YNB6_FASGI|nr:Autophagin-1 (C54 family) [Fasciola gigantica]